MAPWGVDIAGSWGALILGVVQGAGTEDAGFGWGQALAAHDANGSGVGSLDARQGAGAEWATAATLALSHSVQTNNLYVFGLSLIF